MRNDEAGVNSRRSNVGALTRIKLFVCMHSRLWEERQLDTTKNQIAVAKEIKDLIPTYHANRRSEVLELRAALANQDLERVRYLAHRMKGSGGAYGLAHITVLGGRIDKAACEGRADEIALVIDEYDGYLKNVSITIVDR